MRNLFLHIENKEEQGPEIHITLVTTVIAHHEAEEQTVFGQMPDEKELFSHHIREEENELFEN